MAEYTPTLADMLEGLVYSQLELVKQRHADPDLITAESELRRQWAEALAAHDAEVRADERAKRPDREQIDRIQFEIDNVHQIHGDTCLCGFKSSRSRSRTEHLTALFAEAVLALEPEAREEPGPALRIDDDGAHIYWADPVEGCWVAFRRVDCVGEEELPEWRLPAPEAREEPKHGLIEEYTAVQAPDWAKVNAKLEAREEAEYFRDGDGDLWKFTDKGEWFHEEEPGEFRRVLSIDAADQTLTPVGHAELAHAPEAREVTDADSKSRKVLDDLREWIEENRPINCGMFNDGSDDDATAILKIIRRADA